MFWLFYNMHGAHFLAVELENAIRFRTLSRMTGFLWHSSKWTHWFGRFLKYTSGLEDSTTTLTLWLLCSNYPLPWTIKLRQLLGGRCGNFLGVFSWIRNPNSALSWTRGPLLNFPAKCLNFKDPSWVSCDFGLFVLSYLWLVCYLLDS